MASHADPFNLRAKHRLSASLPSLPSSVQELGPVTWNDVKFYPHNGRGSAQVFAVAGASLVIISSCAVDVEGALKINGVFKDMSIKVQNNAKAIVCVEWSRASNGDPLVCIANGDFTITVVNPRTGEVVTTLKGHGDVVFDLGISPATPSYLASASHDGTIRLWSLDPQHKATPTAALLFGGGHDRQVCTVGWHRNGKYLLSGGMDRRLSLWKIPDNLEETLGTDNATRIYHPHFSSTEVHHDSIDGVRFYGDLILSRSANDDKIVLWRIDGFDSSKDPPAAGPVPPGQTVQSDENVYVTAAQIPQTRSAWGGKFQRLLHFAQPDAARLYIRFGLFEAPGMHPMLGVGNEKGEVLFWDLQKLEDAGIGQDISAVQEGETTEKSKAGADKEKTAPKTMPPKGELTTGIGDPLKSMAPHKTEKVPHPGFTVRAVAFSPDGRWCVAVGSEDMVAVFGRWESGFPE